jgi:hypothetical protein
MAISATSSGDTTLSRSKSAARETTSGTLWPRPQLDEHETEMTTGMPFHIGIVACSAEGAALCYRTICVEGARLLGPHAHPEVSMHTPSLAAYIACLESGDWWGVGELMLASARKLAVIGADFLILSRQHHPSGASRDRSALAAALAAHRRGRRG